MTTAISRLVMLHAQMFGSVRFNIPSNTLQVISGTGFYGSNDPTNSVKALKEVRLWLKPRRFIPLRSQLLGKNIAETDRPPSKTATSDQYSLVAPQQ